MKHSRTPWRTYSLWFPETESGQGLSVKDSTGATIAKLVAYNDTTNIENAHKIVECVNSCEGINPNAIPDMVKFIKRVSNSLEVSEAMKQNALNLVKKLISQH